MSNVLDNECVWRQCEKCSIDWLWSKWVDIRRSYGWYVKIQKKKEKKKQILAQHIRNWVVVAVECSFLRCIMLFICINESVYCTNKTNNNKNISICWSTLQKIEPVILVGVAVLLLLLHCVILLFRFDESSTNFHMHTQHRCICALDLFSIMRRLKPIKG